MIYVWILLLISLPISGANMQELLSKGQQAYQEKKPVLAHFFFDQVLTEDPNNVYALFYKADILYKQYRGDAAIPLLKKVIQQNPTDFRTLRALTIVLNTVGRFDEAMKFYELFQMQNPKDEDVRTKLLPLYLRFMDWHYALKLCNPTNLWWYNQNLEQKKVLLDLTSQWNGLGDVLQIIRYAQHLKKAGAFVIVQVRNELVQFLSLCPYLDRIIGKNEPIPEHNYRYTLLADNCTVCMRNTLYQPSQDVPYLFADPSLVKKWRTTLWPDNNFKVGICWQGSKMRDFFTDKIIPGPKSMEIEQLIPLFTIPGISMYSLQYGEDGAIQRCTKKGYVLYNFNLDQQGRFMDTAALMKNLDLIITVDTSIAHLAGGLGVPVWVMLPYAADFRWLSDRSDSPWYPTMQLFRQDKQYEWEPVIERIKKALIEKVSDDTL